MATASLRQRRRLVKRSLREGAGPLLEGARVDREAGVIYGVKVLGLESANGRRYLPEAARKALPMYEGASVRTNHPRRAEDSREVEDVFGWLEDVRVGEGGSLYGDLHVLNPSTDLAESVFLAAEKNPRLFGLSHNAQGQGETIDGTFVVAEITEVRSVDLVADPATTNGLFESRGKRTMKLRDWLEGKAVKALDVNKRRRLKKLFEAVYEDGDADMAEPEGGVSEDPDEALKQGFDSACAAVLAGDQSADEKCKRIKELLKAHEKLGAGGGGEEVEEEDEDLDEEEDEDLDECDDEDGKKIKESKVRKRLRHLEAKDSARDLCEAAGVVPSKALLKALCALGSDKDRKELVEEQKGAASKDRRPRTQTVTEGRKGGSGTVRATDIKDGKGLAEALRRGAFSNSDN